jgi:hypothetical protein
MFTFPALLQIVPSPRGQRLVVPLRDADDLEQTLGSLDDPGGWARDCRLIDVTRHVYAVRYAKGEYEFLPLSKELSDAQLRELMAQNRSAIGRDSGSFELQTRALSGADLFEAVVEHAVLLPELRPSVRAAGLIVIAILVLAALLVPALLLLLLLR